MKPTRTTEPAADSRPAPAAVAGLLLLVFIAFLPALNNGFVGYDDPGYITANEQVRQGLSWAGFQWAFTDISMSNWHPLTWLSHMLDCQMFGMRAWGHHLTSVLLHAANTVLVFLLFQKITGSTRRSFALAALFGVHPLRAESVAWISERKDVLSTFFGLMAVMAYVKGSRASDVEGRVPELSTLDTGLSTFFYALSLLAKPMLVTLPVLLLILDFWPLGRLGRGRLRGLLLEKWPFFALAALSVAATLFAQSHGGAYMSGIPAALRLQNVPVSIVRYLGDVFLPVNLAFFYPYPAAWPLGLVVAASILVVAISIVCAVFFRRAPFLASGWFWFLAALLPVLGIVQAGEQSMADRYTYVASVGVLVMVIWSVPEVRSPASRRVGWVLLILALSAGVWLTRRQAAYWRDSETLFRHALAVTDGNYVAHNNLGTALDQAGRHSEAEQEYRAAIRVRPGYPEALNNLGIQLARQGRAGEAVERFQDALKSDPSFAPAHNAWGRVLDQSGQAEAALEHYREAVRLRPGYADAHYNLGVLLGSLGRIDEAIAQFEEVVRITPASADAHNNLGVALDRKGLLREAAEQYAIAVELQPGFARAHFNLGLALCRLGNLDGGIVEFQEALRLQPDYPEAQRNLELARQARQSQSKP